MHTWDWCFLGYLVFVLGFCFGILFTLGCIVDHFGILGLGSKEVLSWVVMLKVGGVGCFPGEVRL